MWMSRRGFAMRTLDEGLFELKMNVFELIERLPVLRRKIELWIGR